MSVLAPPRPPAPEHPQMEDERRRAQEALIKEARRRARQRRQRYAALLLLAALLAMAIGPTRPGGGSPHGGRDHARGTPRAAAPDQNTAVAHNGKLAFVDGLGLQVVDLDGSADVVAQCPRSSRSCALQQPAWSPDGRQIAYSRGSTRLTPAWGHPSFSIYLKDAD